MRFTTSLIFTSLCLSSLFFANAQTTSKVRIGEAALNALLNALRSETLPEIIDYANSNGPFAFSGEVGNCCGFFQAGIRYNGNLGNFRLRNGFGLTIATEPVVTNNVARIRLRATNLQIDLSTSISMRISPPLLPNFNCNVRIWCVPTKGSFDSHRLVSLLLF